MVEATPKEDYVIIETTTPEVNIERACREYTDTIKVTLSNINENLTAALQRNFESLEELFENIAARTKFLEQNPDFLSLLSYSCSDIPQESVAEFDDIKNNLQQKSTRLLEKIEETERRHNKLFELVEVSGREKRLVIPSSPLPQVSVYIPEYLADSFGKVTIVPNHCLDLQLFSNNDNKENSQNLPFPWDLVPDIERKKASEDLHERLIHQIQASDSLEGFIKHMSRKPDMRYNKKRQEMVAQKILEQKYEGSLWFFGESKDGKGKTSKRKMSSGSSIKSGGSSIKSEKSTKIIKQAPKVELKNASMCISDMTIKSAPSPYISTQEKTRRYRLEMGRADLKCYDLLDDIDTRDVEPIKSEYPRKDNVFEIRTIKRQHVSKKTEETPYLQKILSANEKVWRKLVYPVSPHLKPPHRKRNSEDVQSLMDYLTAPERKFVPHHHHRHLIVMPVKVYYDNYPTKDSPLPQNAEEAKKLIFDREQCILKRVPGHNLVTDLTKPTSPRPEHHTPKSAPPKSPVQTKFEPKIHPELTRHTPIQLPRIPELSPKKTDVKISPLPLQRKKVMLEHLRGLKVRNDSIQKNIQNAIDVIETKMIDLLSSPSAANSGEAFNEMEQEITKVLNMMNEDEKQELEKKIQKYEAEKDENNDKIKPKIKRGQTMVRKPNDFVPGADLGRPVKSEEAKPVPPLIKRQLTDKIFTVEMAPKVLSPKSPSRSQSPKKPKKFYFEEVPVEKDKTKNENKPPVVDKKKAANIEEGERLLGQVDHVIKKIDNIYTKFYKDSKPKTTKDQSYNNVIEFFDGLKKIIDVPPPVELHFKRLENIAAKFQEAKSYNQSQVYHTAVVQYPIKPKIDHTGDGLVPLVQAIEEVVVEELTDRHDVILKTFYTVFFSSLLVAMNFDYSC